MNAENNGATTPNNFVAYEYKTIVANRKLASVYADCYPRFGWQLEDNTFSNHSNRVSLTFKRNRQLKNKPEINKMQRQFEDGIQSITYLEETKNSKAGIVAITIGLIGTAFLAGATFSFLAGLIVACIVLAVPGFIGWGMSYAVYKKMSRARASEIVTQIDQEYDSIYAACEKANALLA